ncbi:collagen alpha-1(XII) chain-like [Mytilus californianus]|uniref:collagen alpha-1(XII) chain-like n=1 Tax=Mytilus californianus TaxID=6549 RepID=UPI0022457DA5|nr:collagen alpha-1(XII) chain-like [Mytilus californianus]
MHRIFVGMILIYIASCQGPKDVVFVLDRSGSLDASDVTDAIEFIYNVTVWLTIGDNNALISLVTFSDNVTEEFNLGNFPNKTDLLSAIESLSNMTSYGGTFTFDALEFVLTTSFNESSGGRSGAERAVVVLTDGASLNYIQTVTMADRTRSELGAEIFSIGIGSTQDSDELNDIANDPDSYYALSVQDYVYLCNLVPTLVIRLDMTVNATLSEGCPLFIPTTFQTKAPQKTTTSPSATTTSKEEPSTTETSTVMRTTMVEPSTEQHITTLDETTTTEKQTTTYESTTTEKIATSYLETTKTTEQIKTTTVTTPTMQITTSLETTSTAGQTTEISDSTAPVQISSTILDTTSIAVQTTTAPYTTTSEKTLTTSETTIHTDTTASGQDTTMNQAAQVTTLSTVVVTSFPARSTSSTDLSTFHIITGSEKPENIVASTSSSFSTGTAIGIIIAFLFLILLLILLFCVRKKLRSRKKASPMSKEDCMVRQYTQRSLGTPKPLSYREATFTGKTDMNGQLTQSRNSSMFDVYV